MATPHYDPPHPLAGSLRFDEMISAIVQKDLPIRPERFVFVHVDKSAGSSIGQTLSNQFPATNVFRYDGDAPELREHALRTPDSFIFGHFARMDSLFTELGHLRYAAVTTLRDPVERMISGFRFAWLNPMAAWHREVHYEGMDLPSFTRATLDRGGAQFAYFRSHPDLAQADVKKALQVLDQGTVLFGMADRLEEFLLALTPVFGFSDIFKVFRCNSMGKAAANHADLLPTPSENDITETRGLLADDVMFYEGADQLYAARMSTLWRTLSVDIDEVRKRFHEIADRQTELVRELAPSLADQPPMFKTR